MVPKLIRTFFETPTTVQNYLEETLLTFPDEFGDWVQKFIYTWRDQIENLLPYVENSHEEQDKILNDLSA